VEFLQNEDDVVIINNEIVIINRRLIRLCSTVLLVDMEVRNVLRSVIDDDRGTLGSLFADSSI